MKLKDKLKKIVKFLELSYTVSLALVLAIVFKSGGIYAKNLPIVLAEKIVIEKQVFSPRANPVIAKSSTIVDPPIVNYFPWGQCTWYVASKRKVTWNGHARSWFWNAKAQGRPVGKIPKVGSIIVLNQGYYGHVGFIEKVNGNIITYSESNNPIPGRITRQTVNYKTLPVIGFIY